MQDLLPYLWVGVGGFLGANARYVIGRVVGAWLGPSFPYATFFINVSGSFLLGFLSALLASGQLPHARTLREFFAIGFLGAYTTFSTFEYETRQLFDDGSWLLAMSNIFGSVFLGLLGVHVGMVLGRSWR
ncbi:MAG: putative fluoride ion transporter CrcB [Candidatus Sumerlaea sp.]|uniref:Fluoride-specific ion channel FluC n=1 Tax=Sumerlaea chitinivorans TaxID=2250252 RepID=A0A2Z4Y6R0_SUMC1|nr:CrcB protein [Candidatus Sumerlaea chitinivorans]MCX7964201.1 fluoride efflux transporter CrcB [Candidatus Sumerlaea chitinivorans]GIX44938.1 MAG: putative fluoride ion transporter CrcB [Candidatus Sumerlaea sp.]